MKQSLQSTVDDNIISIQAEITLEKAITKTELMNLKLDLNGVLENLQKYSPDKNLNSDD